MNDNNELLAQLEEAKEWAAVYKYAAQTACALGKTLEKRHMSLIQERNKLLNAIKEHHAQKADDRCIEDDDRLYEAAGLPPCDRRVGDKEAMLHNCARFIENRCQGGGWPTYVELEEKIRLKNVALAELCCGSCDCLTKTPEPQYHDPECRYRIAKEGLDL